MHKNEYQVAVYKKPKIRVEEPDDEPIQNYSIQAYNKAPQNYPIQVYNMYHQQPQQQYYTVQVFNKPAPKPQPQPQQPSIFTPKNSFMLGNYIANKMFNAQGTQAPPPNTKETNNINNHIDSLKYLLSNDEQYRNEPRKTIVYNGETIEIPLSLIPDDKSFLERHGNKIKNAAIAVGSFGALGYGAYKGQKLINDYAMPVINMAIGGAKKVAGIAENVITAPKKALEAVGNAANKVKKSAKKGTRNWIAKKLKKLYKQ